MSRALVDSMENIYFLVQDSGGAIEEGNGILPQELMQGVEFVQHDFFTEQPLKSADVDFLRWILHEWNDKYAFMILRNVALALKAEATIIV